jgi:hypothetical protein
MKRIALLTALAIGLLGTTAATCQKTDPNGPSPVDHVVDGVVDCAKAGVHEAAIGIIDNVASALATGDYVSALGDLVKRFGEGAVDCAVAEVADTAGKHASMNQLEADKAQRAKAWLASRPVKVTAAPETGIEWGIAGLCPRPFGCASEGHRFVSGATLTVPIGHGRFAVMPVDEATRMTGEMPIGLTDYNDVACANFKVQAKTGVILSVRRWYCESI